MILEVVMLDVKPSLESAFEGDFDLATAHLVGSEGYLSHELHRGIETPNRYVLLVRWETLEAHTEGFRKSPGYQEWKRLLHHYYDPFPTVEHFAGLLTYKAPGLGEAGRLIAEQFPVDHAVAMANAKSEVKAAARQVIGHCDDDEIGPYIEQWL